MYFNLKKLFLSYPKTECMMYTCTHCGSCCTRNEKQEYDLTDLTPTLKRTNDKPSDLKKTMKNQKHDNLNPLFAVPDPVGSAIELSWLRGKSKRKRAATAAMYYGEAYLRGIPPIEADLAASNSKDCYTKWWLQQRFQIGDSVLNGVTHDQDACDTNEDLLSRHHNKITSIVHPKEDPIQTLKVGSDSLHGDARFRRKKRKSSYPVDNFPVDNTHPCANGDLDKTRVTQFFTVSRDESSSEGSTCPSLPAQADNKSAMSESRQLKANLREAKANVLFALKQSRGCTEDHDFQSALNRLETLFKSTGSDFRCIKYQKSKKNELDGVWLTMSNPKYQECLGRNAIGDYIYTLGRMSFDMFRPAALKCSIQGIFNPIASTNKIPKFVPSSLRKEIDEGACLRTYNIVVSFSIEPDNGEIRNPVQGVMTNYGYILPDPKVKNRFTVWFTGGTIEPNDETNKTEWFKIFGADSVKHEPKERAMQLASKALLGVKLSESLSEDGSMSFYLSRPIGGHGNAFVDIAFCDKSLRIIRGQHNSIYVLAKVPSVYLR